jgi:two-component sensor histidine kinase
VNNRVDDQKKFYEAILNNLPVDIAIFNYDHKYLYINSKAVKNEEVRDYLIGRDDFDYCVLRGIDNSKAKARREVFEKVRNSKEIIEFEDSSETEDGSFKYISRRFVPVLNSLGDFSFMLGYGVDVTKLKQQELVLGRSLREKELLLGEIHHGVKNNLTLIVALLEINSVHEKDALVKKYFNEIRNRISALALIYDKLYRSEVFNQINLNEYISSLLSSLQQSFLPGSRDIVELNVDHIYVDNKVAVPIALLINELVSNAFMHAFPFTEFPKLKLSLKRETDSSIKLVVADNGVGLPEGIDIVEGKTFGFKLIGLFARQLKGKVHYTNSQGFRIEVEFQNMLHEVRN